MGRALERRRFEFLPELAGQGSGGGGGNEGCHALLLGDGDGRFLTRFLEANPIVLVDYVDSSGEMGRLARRRVLKRFGDQEAARRVTFHQADARVWTPPEARRYRFILTHFFLDCLTDREVDGLLHRLRPRMEPDAAWIVSEFHQPAHGFAAWRARVWIGGLYRLFGLTTGLRVRRLPDYRRRLATHGFRITREVQAERGLLVSEWWQREP